MAEKIGKNVEFLLVLIVSQALDETKLRYRIPAFRILHYYRRYTRNNSGLSRNQTVSPG